MRIRRGVVVRFWDLGGKASQLFWFLLPNRDSPAGVHPLFAYYPALLSMGVKLARDLKSFLKVQTAV